MVDYLKMSDKVITKKSKLSDINKASISDNNKLSISDNNKASISNNNKLNNLDDNKLNNFDDNINLNNSEFLINTEEINNTQYINKNKNIFIKNNNEYIDILKMKIFNSEEENNKSNEIKLKKELNEFIIKNKNNDNNIILLGGGNKKIEIKKINDIYKMKFNDDYSTLTDQNINLNNNKLIKKIRHRKYMRHNRIKKT